MEHDPPSARISQRAPQRWPRDHRLRTARDFERVRRRGQRVSASLLALSYTRRAAETKAGDEATTPEGPPTRIGLSVSRRVGGAVERNRVKRWLRESIRHRYTDLAPGWDIIVMARAGAAAAGYNAVDTEARGLIARARLWRPSAQSDAH